MSKEINRISLGQLDGAVLTYEDGNGETVEVKFDGSGCDELNHSEENDKEKSRSITMPDKKSFT